MDQPLDLCVRTSKVKDVTCTKKMSQDFKHAEKRLSSITASGYGIEDNEKMVQRWLQHMPADRMISTEYSPYLQTNPGSTGSRISFDPNISSEVSKTNIIVKLYNNELWRSFSQEGTEMIINRSGRLMYPRVEVTMEGLKASSMYSVGMTVIPVDDKRYKYKDNVWSAVGKSEITHPVTPYKHPTSPATGSFWMRDIISFGHAKLSNHLGPNKIYLESMHKYMVQINVVHHSQEDHLYNFTLPGTEFIALTAYLNQKITSLKISHNPFARAFKNKILSDVDIDPNQTKKKPRRKSKETSMVSFYTTSSSGNSGMDPSVTHFRSSAGVNASFDIRSKSASINSNDSSACFSSDASVTGLKQGVYSKVARETSQGSYDTTSSFGNSAMEGPDNRFRSSAGVARETSQGSYDTTSSFGNSAMEGPDNRFRSAAGVDGSYDNRLKPASTNSSDSLIGFSSDASVTGLNERVYSSFEDRLRRKFMERARDGNHLPPMLCLVTSSGLYYQSLPY